MRTDVDDSLRNEDRNETMKLVAIDAHAHIFASTGRNLRGNASSPPEALSRQ